MTEGGRETEDDWVHSLADENATMGEQLRSRAAEAQEAATWALRATVDNAAQDSGARADSEAMLGTPSSPEEERQSAMVTPLAGKPIGVLHVADRTPPTADWITARLHGFEKDHAQVRKFTRNGGQILQLQREKQRVLDTLCRLYSGVVSEEAALKEIERKIEEAGG